MSPMSQQAPGRNAEYEYVYVYEYENVYVTSRIDRLRFPPERRQG